MGYFMGYVHVIFHGIMHGFAEDHCGKFLQWSNRKSA